MIDSTESYGALSAPRTLTIQRVLPGPIERVWSYLTDGELRRKWLASGDMPLRAGAPFTLTWRNNELTEGPTPTGPVDEETMESRVIAVDPPNRLVISWGKDGEVSFDLKSTGEKVLLTLIHSDIPNRSVMLNIAAGWHTHLDILVARATEAHFEPFWDRWRGLKADYDERLPA